MIRRRNYHLQKRDRRLLITWRELQEKFVKVWPTMWGTSGECGWRYWYN